MYNVVYTKTFERDFGRLEKIVARRVAAKITGLSAGLFPIQPLKYAPKGLGGLCKLKVGDWRVLFWVNYKDKVITLYAIEHRSSIYRNLK